MSSKISNNAANAFIAGQPFSEGNTTVIVDTSGLGSVTMYLHGNAIAKRINEGHYAETMISLAGWPTVTTRARLDAILSKLTGAYYRGICQRNHEQTLIRFDGQGTIIDSKGWHCVSKAQF